VTKSGSAQKKKKRAAARRVLRLTERKEKTLRGAQGNVDDGAAAVAATEFFVHGITLGSSRRRPVLILKDSDEQATLPIWLNPIDASYALADFAHQAYAAHAVTLQLLERFALKLERCLFIEVRGHHQYVRLEFSGNPQVTQMELRADEAMSLCLAMGARYFASPDFVSRCREVEAEMAAVEEGIRLRPEIGSKNHPYVM
jgi:bifunctional DNase/RNase